MTRPRALSPFAFVAAFALVVALAIGLALAARRTLAERWLLAELRARGVSSASLSVARLDRGGFEVRDLVLGDPAAPDLVVASVDARWSLAGLRAGQLDAMRIDAPRLRGTLGEGGLVFGALDPLFADDGAAEPDEPLALPAPDFALSGGEIVLATPQGVASSSVDGQLRLTDEGGIAGAFGLRFEHPLARANGTVVVSGTLAELAAELALDLRDGREPARVAPARLTGSVSGAPSALVFDLALGGADGRLRAEARGRADLPSRSAHAALRLAPLRLAADGLRPVDLLPALEPFLTRFGIAKVVGRIEARGELAVVDGEPALSLDLAFSELGFASAFANTSGIAGTLALRTPGLHSPKGQLVSVALLDPGIALRDGLIDFQLRPGGALAIRRTTWRWADGELRAEDVTLDLAAERTPVRLEAHGLDLAELLPLAAVKGLEGTGRIDGEMPLVSVGKQLQVENGFLRARPEGGTIRFEPTESVRAMAKSRPNDLGMAVAAFSDFHYEKLEARVDGDIRGELRIALHVRGANPAFQSGQPIELNLNLDARLLDLVRAGVSAYRVPAAVEERLREFSEEEKGP